MRKIPGPSEGNEHYKFISGTSQLTTHIIINAPSLNQASFEQYDSFRELGSFSLPRLFINWHFLKTAKVKDSEYC